MLHRALFTKSSVVVMGMISLGGIWSCYLLILGCQFHVHFPCSSHDVHGRVWLVGGILCWTRLARNWQQDNRTPWCLVLITLVNKDFSPWGKLSVSDVFLDAEFKYVSRISLSPTPFALHQTMWMHTPTYMSHWGPVGGSLDTMQLANCHVSFSCG